jgi:hypothetical protein
MVPAQISFTLNHQLQLMKNGQSLSSFEKIQKVGMPSVGCILLDADAGLTFGATP